MREPIRDRERLNHIIKETKYNNKSQVTVTWWHHRATRRLTAKTICFIVFVLFLLQLGTISAQTHYELTMADCATGLGWGRSSYTSSDYWVYYTAPEGCRIKVTLYDESLEYGLFILYGFFTYPDVIPNNYSYDYIYLKDGTSEPTAPYSQSWNRSNVTGDLTYISSGNSLALKYDNNSGLRVYLNYRVEIVDCDCEPEESYSEPITRTINVECNKMYTFYDSGEGSGNYDNNENYTYTFHNVNNGTVHVKFVQFRTESNYDFMTISSNTTILARVSGELTTGQQYDATAGQDLVINFTSDSGVTYAGWYAIVWVDECCNLDAEIEFGP